MGVENKVSPIARVTLADRVYGDLRELLLAGQVEPGEKFSLRSLAASMGTSLMPVRDAVGRLAAENALEVQASRVVRVPIMTRERFRELTVIRCEIEGLAAQHAAVNARNDELAEIRALHEKFAEVSMRDVPDGAAALQINKDLHFAVYRAAHMPQLLQIIDGLWLQIGPVINLDLRASGRRLKEVEAHKHHGRLIAALEAKDGEGSRNALAADISSAAEFILNTSDIPSATNEKGQDDTGT